MSEVGGWAGKTGRKIATMKKLWPKCGEGSEEIIADRKNTKEVATKKSLRSGTCGPSTMRGGEKGAKKACWTSGLTEMKTSKRRERWESDGKRGSDQSSEKSTRVYIEGLRPLQGVEKGEGDVLVDGRNVKIKTLVSTPRTCRKRKGGGPTYFVQTRRP